MLSFPYSLSFFFVVFSFIFLSLILSFSLSPPHSHARSHIYAHTHTHTLKPISRSPTSVMHLPQSNFEHILDSHLDRWVNDGTAAAAGGGEELLTRLRGHIFSVYSTKLFRFTFYPFYSKHYQPSYS